MINCRHVDYRSYRWNQRIPSWRTICRLSLPHRGLDSAGGRYRMPKSSCQPTKFRTRHWLHFCGCPRSRSETSKITPASIFLPQIYQMTVSQLTLSGSDPTPLTIPPITPSSLNFLESVEAAHSSHSFNDRVSTLLGITRPPIRVDSQAKYCCLARGDAGAYLRMPTGVGYREKIWVGFLRRICCFVLHL